jgi:choline-glycine betaine transporter
MTQEAPSNDIRIATQSTGFYAGFNVWVAAVPKVVILALIAWVAASPSQAGQQLQSLQTWSTASFGSWYIYVTTFFTTTCLALALWPRTGRLVLGQPGDTPEFSQFTWLSMMFGAGIGIGMLTYSTAEPIFHFATNPETIQGTSTPLDADNVRNAYKWALLHYGLTPWACYGIIGIALGYLRYAKGMPLTIRSGLQPLFGSSLSGWLGHLVDIAAILATLIGLGVTIGYGVSQFSAGLFNISGLSFLVNDSGQPTLSAQITGLVLIVSASCLSALSGIQRGIKWLSNVNMGLSIFLVSFFIIFGSTAFALSTFGFARVSRGRTVREYVLGAIIMPAMICLTWLTFVGATAIDLELQGIAGGSIVNADISAQLFATINLMLSPDWAVALSVVVVLLLLTFLITSADSGILIINTLASGGSQNQKGAGHIVIWGVIFAVLIGALLSAGGMDALRSAMILGALPFSIVMALMAIALIKAMVSDALSDSD